MLDGLENSSYEFKYCPEEFRENCKGLEVYCFKCTANKDTGDNLYYSPISSDKDLSAYNHPVKRKVAKEWKDKRKEERESRNTAKVKEFRKYNRQGRVMEKKVISSIAGAKLTYASGSLTGDGDGKLKLKDTTYHFSHKARFSPRNELGPTSKEWYEGKGDGCDIWLTTSEKYGTVVTMPKKVFDELISFINEINE